MQVLKISRGSKLFAQFTAYPQIMRCLSPLCLWITLMMPCASPWASAENPNHAFNEIPNEIAVPTSRQSAAPIVLVSIAPLATLVRDVWPGAQVQVLIDGSQDFHHFQWQPAQMARLQQADWVVWLGPQQQPALVSTLQRLPAKKVITLGATPALVDSAHDHTQQHAAEIKPAQADYKPAQAVHADIHVWLDQAAVSKMLMTLGERWQQPAAAAQQQQVHQQFWLRWQARLAPLRKRAFVIQHDAIGSWVQYFGLTQRFAITADHEHEPGVQQLWQMRQQLLPQSSKANQPENPFTSVVCYLQTQTPDPWWPKISAGVTPQINTASLDLFSARDYPPVDGSHYLGFIQQNLEKLEACLR